MNVSDTLDPPLDVSTLPARERILTAAYRSFYRNGIRATGVDKVIAEAGVTKVTFYRHFESKDTLVVAFLDLRHHRWMEWFRDALERHATSGRRGRSPVVGAIEEWLTADSFRGCAFINSVNELGGDLPQIYDIAARHKTDMVAAIRDTLPPGPHRTRNAQALGVAVDGAIVHAQYARGGAAAVKALATIAASLRADEVG
ncbi:TetR/AcrR family transcriptional regulator [Mycobacterium yunnanensis]|uniref:TetR/AcrR family transcriptional regulator n=1 Tax=Mycobacterium yunnanensis TaxID=368477 RepID=A0A9X3BSD9_9MYCO|nr:TetR/AcrR family transcriptional regulator [Mycobacterium yunnanensis]MCV7420484.1 TetR/AcrR family transcriptional regulator [Mycobacterium yunnanensis]